MVLLKNSRARFFLTSSIWISVYTDLSGRDDLYRLDNTAHRAAEIGGYSGIPLDTQTLQRQLLFDL
jgi:hypothetical protein